MHDFEALNLIYQMATKASISRDAAYYIDPSLLDQYKKEQKAFQLCESLFYQLIKSKSVIGLSADATT